MLRDHPSLAVGFVQLQFEPHLAYSARASLAGAAVQTVLKAVDWKLGPGSCVIDDKIRRSHFAIETRRLQYQSLGVKALFTDIDTISHAFESAIQVLGLTEIQPVRMHIHGFFPFGMTHPEIVTLFLDEFFQPASKFQKLVGSPTDLLCQLHGVKNGFDVRLTSYPMTTDQVRLAVNVIPNLEHFGRNDCFNPIVTEFVDSIARDCCSLDVEAVSAKGQTTGLAELFRDLLNTIESTMTETIKLLKAFK